MIGFIFQNPIMTYIDPHPPRAVRFKGSEDRRRRKPVVSDKIKEFTENYDLEILLLCIFP